MFESAHFIQLNESNFKSVRVHLTELRLSRRISVLSRGRTRLLNEQDILGTSSTRSLPSGTFQRHTVSHFIRKQFVINIDLL